MGSLDFRRVLTSVSACVHVISVLPYTCEFLPPVFLGGGLQCAFFCSLLEDEQTDAKMCSFKLFCFRSNAPCFRLQWLTVCRHPQGTVGCKYSLCAFVHHKVRA